MNKITLLEIALPIFLISSASVASDSRRAIITGGGGNGRCTIEVNVDGIAEIEVAGDMGILRTISGQPPIWRRFECNAPLPRHPIGFRFVRTGGRGEATLLRDPASNRGTATIQISDQRGGRAVYALDLLWREGGGGPHSGPAAPLGHGPWEGRSPVQIAIRSCQDAVTRRLSRDGYRSVIFDRTIPDTRPAGNDRINGSVSAKRGFETSWFRFSCSADFRLGTVRSVDVRSH